MYNKPPHAYMLMITLNKIRVGLAFSRLYDLTSPIVPSQRYHGEVSKIESNMDRCLKEDPAFRSINKAGLDKISKKYERRLHTAKIRANNKMVADRSFQLDARNRLICSAVAAAVAESSTLPIDTTKVRLQLMSSKEKTGAMSILKSIYKSDGITGLWRGIVPALLRQVSYTSITFMLFEPIRDFITRDPEQGVQLWQRFLAGGVAGATGIAIMNPTEIIKTKMQGASKSAAVGGRCISILCTIVYNVHSDCNPHSNAPKRIAGLRPSQVSLAKS